MSFTAGHWPSEASVLVDSTDLTLGRSLCLANLDKCLRVTAANREFVDFVGGADVDVFGRELAYLLHPRVRQQVRLRLADLVHGRRTRFLEPVVPATAESDSQAGQLTGVSVRGTAEGSVSVVILVSPADRAIGRDAGPGVGADERPPVLAGVDARVLERLAVGDSTVKIAADLYLSRQGVEYHISGLMRQFDSPNRAALVSRAYAQGLLVVGQWPPRVEPLFVR